MHLPTEDKSDKSRNEMKEELIVLLGGRVAEALVLDDISTGASNDIERATKIVRAMVMKIRHERTPPGRSPTARTPATRSSARKWAM